MSYTLDKTDMRILYELSKNSRIADTRIAKIIKKSKESVRYRIKKMIDNKIILGFNLWTDPSKLGLASAKIYLNLANIPQKKKSLLEFVKKDKRLYWMGIVEGAWNIGLTYFVKDNEEFFTLKNELVTKFKDLILDVRTASLVGVYWFQYGFLFNEKSEPKKIWASPQKNTLDDVSFKILGDLSKNSRENLAEISHNHSVSVDIIRNRMKMMESKGIIARYTIKINYNKLDLEFYKTFLYFKNLNKNSLSELRSYCNSQPNIINLVQQISPWDIELEIMCKNYFEYNSILSELTEKFSSIISRTETAILSEDLVKSSLE